jgi:hypothetical protein
MGKRNVAALAAVGLLCGASGLVLEVGCGGSSSDPVLGDAPDSGKSDGATQTDAASEAYTLDNVCTRVNPKVCALRKPCCEKSFGYDEAFCLADVNADCAADVADVRAGRATFHPELIDPCLKKYEALFASCEGTFEIYARALKVFKDCRIFDGQLPDGASCTRTSQCKAPTAANEVASCDEDNTKQCVTFKILAENDACELKDGARGVCDEGLYCDITSFATFSGTCKKKTPIGQPCNATKKSNLECGFGNRCDESGVCAVGKPGGASCTSDLDCASVKCTPKSDAELDSGAACEPPAPLVKREECKGT